MNVAPEERFFWKVRKTNGCWLWTAGRRGDGYGQFYVSGKAVGAHRFSWLLHFGVIPDGLCVCHTCDNPPCVNPDHLFIGTVRDNFDDMVSKGRNNILEPPRLRGSKNSQAKLTEEIARDILSRDYSGYGSVTRVAREFGVTRESIWNIRKRLTWQHIS